LASDIHKIFFVLNKASLIPECEAAVVTAYTKQNLEAIPGLGKARLFLIDAKEQLKAGGDLQRLSPTNQFREFAEELQRFLVQEQGRVVVENPGHRVLRRLAALRDSSLCARS